MPNILAAIVAFGAMIFFHELGHFLMAKRAGVRVHAFAIGFGPALVRWTRGGTRYALNLLPFGGYVRMEGEDSATAGEGSFQAKSVGARISIIAAGPLMNLVMAVVILAVAAAAGGVATSTRVRTIEAGWPAEAAGLQPGDRIVGIGGQVMGTDQLIDTINRSVDRTLVLDVRRGAEALSVTVTPRLDPARGVGRIGFAPEPVFTRLHPGAALVWGVHQTGRYIVLLAGIIERLVREGRLLEHLGGPLAAGDQLRQAAELGILVFLHLTAQFSILIGFFNLLPIPALDGGRLAFLLAEAVRRRPVLDARREGLVHTVGLALLLLLLATVTLRDLRRLFE
ncbi:MAG: M50 family metallopeptidase [Armatimonadota bacterium]|nr:M50 family metallopeptidase [Armatimonadota bacterium]MDR7532893.1 M50 family metallopeptidase [Armatimonadota bacterium]MDR7536100.1 M50 family metallopeptidase [Armatimonadota bacterium]